MMSKEHGIMSVIGCAMRSHRERAGTGGKTPLPFLDGEDDRDLVVYHIGRSDCRPGHRYGPSVRDYFMIHYASRGRGVFRSADRTYHLRARQGFLICPSVLHFYQADLANPWTYQWVGFHGRRAQELLEQAGLSAENPVFTCSKHRELMRCFGELSALRQDRLKNQELRATSILFRLLACLTEMANRRRGADRQVSWAEIYVRRAVIFTQRNYARKITIAGMAAAVGIERKYLCALFQKVRGVSPQRFLITYRMRRACELLGSPSIAIGDVARSVGYEDPLLFSRMFKKVMGECPKRYRERAASGSGHA